MPTYKKHFRRKIKTVKKRQKKRDRHIKVLVCYKININNSKFGGAPKKDDYNRLDELLIELDKKKGTGAGEKKLINEIVKKNGKIENDAKRKKIFAEIFKENVLIPSMSLDEKEIQKVQRESLTKERQNIKKLLEYLTSGKFKDQIQEDTLLNLLKKKVLAEKLFGEITTKIESPEFKKLFTDAQLKSIKKNLTNGNGNGNGNGIASSLTSIKSSILDGAVSLGQWFSTPTNKSNTGEIEKLENKQIVRFLWYPRKHTVYKKGNSTSTKNQDDGDEYGDFMIIVDPEKYASTGEFFKQTYHSVEDLLATLLLGCNDMFCTKSGVNPGQPNEWSESVKRKPYNWRQFDIVNKQPQKDLTTQNNADITVRS